MLFHTEVVRPRVPLVSRTRTAIPAHRPRINLVAGFLGALAATGLLLVVSLTVALLTVLLGTTRRGAGAIGTALTSATLTSSVLMAALLALVVLLPFVVGGYVGTRLARADARVQAVVVWGWVVLPATSVVMVALGSGGPARHAVTTVAGDPASVMVVLSVLALSLLGALLGADTGRRRRPARSTR